MSDRVYRQAFFVMLTGCLGLAAAVAYLYWQRIHPAPVAQSGDPVVARGPAAGEAQTSQAATGADTTEPALAPIQITPQRMQEIGVSIAPVEFKEVGDQMDVPGNVEINEQSLTNVQTRYAGWIQTVSVNAAYQYVNKGQKLFTIYSPDLVSTEQEYLLAKQNQKNISGETHGMAAQEGTWLLDAAEERLRQFAVPESVIKTLEETGKVQREIAVESPASGYILERNAMPNAYVQMDTKLYTIADLSTVWVYANVFQDAVGRLKPGDAATVTVDAYPGKNFNGRVDQILPQVDPTTRTVRVRLVMHNPGVLLKPGMFVNAAIKVPLGRQIVVPAGSVLESGTRAVAFVDRGQGNLEPREIEIGPKVGGSIIVMKGLKAGEQVVSSASFLVDSEAQLQAAMSSFAPVQPGANAPAAQAKPEKQEQILIAISTDPTPLRKGANTVRIQLTGADGKPLDGVQVSAVFFMPAMPDMGMAAEHAAAALTAKGQGLYEGPLDLPSGGSFKVTVTVQRAGAVIATKKLTLSATGGM